MDNEKNIPSIPQEFDITGQNYSTFWQTLLKKLRKREYSQNLKDVPKALDPNKEDEPTEVELPSPESKEEIKQNLFDIINTYIDFPHDEGQRSKLFESLYNNADTNSTFWNRSVDDLFKLFKERLATINDEMEVGLGLKLSDIKKADAGFSFNAKPWVCPNINVNGEVYDEVRQEKIIDTLNDQINLQFTRTKNGTNKWIRLLMPEYSRRVEVEDLDRNFWAIAQVLSAISRWLFGQGQVINEALEGLLNEVAQLWENVLYLWLDFAILSQRINSGLRTIITYIPEAKYQYGKKYNGFGQNGDKITIEDIKKSINYLIDKYPYSNLCVLPIVRCHNYKHNYYSRERYKGLFLHSQAQPYGEWTVYKFQTEVKQYDTYDDGKDTNYVGVPEKSNITEDLIISLEDIGDHPQNMTFFYDYLYGFKERSDGYEYLGPFSDAQNITDEETYYYCALRVLPFVDVTYDSYFKIQDIFFEIGDALSGIISAHYQGSEDAGSFITIRAYSDKGDIDDEKHTITFHRPAEVNYKKLSSLHGFLNFRVALDIPDTLHLAVSTPAPYLGEVVSWRNQTKKVYNLEVKEQPSISKPPSSGQPSTGGSTSIDLDTVVPSITGHLIKIANFMPKDYRTENWRWLKEQTTFSDEDNKNKNTSYLYDIVPCTPQITDWPTCVIVSNDLVNYNNIKNYLKGTDPAYTGNDNKPYSINEIAKLTGTTEDTVLKINWGLIIPQTNLSQQTPSFMPEQLKKLAEELPYRKPFFIKNSGLRTNLDEIISQLKDKASSYNGRPNEAIQEILFAYPKTTYDTASETDSYDFIYDWLEFINLGWVGRKAGDKDETYPILNIFQKIYTYGDDYGINNKPMKLDNTIPLKCEQQTGQKLYKFTEIPKSNETNIIFEDYENLGFSVISNWLFNNPYYNNLNVENVKSVHYFVTALGACPCRNDNYGFWNTNILLHLYRFIPKALLSQIKNVGYKFKWAYTPGGGELGIVQCLGVINREETFCRSGPTSIGDNIFIKHQEERGRLPQFYPYSLADGILMLQESKDRGGKIYYFRYKTFAEENPEDELTKKINEQCKDGKTLSDCEKEKLKSIGDELKTQLQKNPRKFFSSPDGTTPPYIIEEQSFLDRNFNIIPKGVWSVFDAKTEWGKEENSHSYTNAFGQEGAYREVATTGITFDEQIADEEGNPIHRIGSIRANNSPVPQIRSSTKVYFDGSSLDEIMLPIDSENPREAFRIYTPVDAPYFYKWNQNSQ